MYESCVRFSTSERKDQICSKEIVDVTSSNSVPQMYESSVGFSTSERKDQICSKETVDVTPSNSVPQMNR
jgi:hypothetical protein